MESIEKNISEEPVEPVECNISNEEEKGSGKGKLPENQLTTTPAVSFQKAIVDSTSTRTPTISKILQYCDNTSEKDESQEINKVQQEISDQQNLLNDSNKSDTDKDTNWEQSLQDEELLVVVVEECSNDDQLTLQIEEETISAASTPNVYGKNIDTKIF
jgi:hypothetical protein